MDREIKTRYFYIIWVILFSVFAGFDEIMFRGGITYGLFMLLYYLISIDDRLGDKK